MSMSLMYIKQRTFVREAPITQCNVLGSLQYGKTVEPTGQVRGIYSEIRFGIAFGWVHTEALTDVPMRKHAILKKDDYPAENMMDVANECLSKIPIGIIRHIQKNGWSILITSKDLDEHFYNGQYGGVGGVTDYGNRDIYLQHVRWDIENCTAHEIGHVIDYIAGFVSDNPEFVAAFEEEKHNFKDSTSVGDGHEISCPREYFASLFSEFLKNPGACNASVPKSSTFIANFVNKF